MWPASITCSSTAAVDPGKLQHPGGHRQHANIKATYTQKKGNLVQALMTAAPELEFMFLGLNEADSGSAVTVNLWRAKLGPAQSIPLIGDDYAALEMTGAAMADASRPAGTSQYFQTFIEDTTA